MSARSTLRQRVRYDALDKESVNWLDAEINDALNRAVNYVALELARHDMLEVMLGTETFSSTAGTKAYALSATDILHFRELYWANPDSTSKDIKCWRIDRRLRSDVQSNQWRYFPSRNSTTKLWSINFVNDPGGGDTFRVEYVKRPIVASSDADEYTTIPEPYDDLIIARTVWQLTGPDGSLREHAATNFLNLLAQAKSAVQADALPDEDRVRLY